MHRISTDVVELYVYYNLHTNNVLLCRVGTAVLSLYYWGRGPRGRLAGGGARGGGWQVADSEGFPLAPSRVAARGSRLASPRLAPRLARLARVYKGFIAAVTVTGAAADAVTVAVAVRGSGEMRFPETERETA